MTSKPIILVIGHPELTPKDAWDAFCNRFDVLFYNFLTTDEFHNSLSSGTCSKIQGILKIGFFPEGLERLNHGWTVEALKYFPESLQFITQLGHGYEQEDISGLKRRGIEFRNSTGGSEATATVGLYLIIAAFRNLRRYELMARSGQFLQAMGHSAREAVDPYGKALGIVGMGSVGQALARQAQGLGMKIHYVSRGNTKLCEDVLEATKHPSIDAMLPILDCLLLACPYGPETHHLIDFESFAKMKRGIRVVNISRGKCMNEVALIEALERGIVGGVGLDVFETEPIINPKLLENDAVTVLPHVGGLSRDAFANHEHLCIRNIERHFNV